MSADRLERDLTTWLAETAAPRTPDWTDDIVLATAGLRQRPGWTFLERWIPMLATDTGRLAAFAAVVAVLGIAGAGLMIMAGQRDDIPPVTPAPSAPAAAPSPSIVAVPLPEPLRQTWVADIGAIDGLEADPQVDFVVGQAGEVTYLVTNDFDT